MNTSQKNEIRSIFKGYNEINHHTELILFNDNNQHFFIGYDEFNTQELEDFLIKDDNLSINQSHRYIFYPLIHYDDGSTQGYTIAAFFSKCSERFGEKQAKVLSNLFFYCHTKFNLFHRGNSRSGLLHCDIIVPDKMVKEVHEAFNIIFEYRSGREEHLRTIKLSKGAVFEMDIASFYHYFNPNMFIYKTKLLSDDDFVKVKDKRETIGKWQPERIDNPKLNPFHPDAPPFPIWKKRFEEYANYS